MPLSKATTSLDRTFLALTSALFVTRPSTALSTKLDISALTLEKSPMPVHSLDAQSVSPAQTNSLGRLHPQSVTFVLVLTCHSHSRIHNNPNSRRGKGQHTAAAHQAAVAAVQAGLMEPGSGLAHMMPPPTKPISRSAPSSNIGSPNVSPPHSFSSYSPNMGNDLAAYRQGGLSNSTSPNGLSRNMDLLADAASRLEQRPHHHSQNTRQHLTSGYHPYNHRLPGLSQYAYSSQPMSRSHSHEDDDPYAHRMTKKSRPGSPMSTAPPSPTFSHDSASPTPDHTPLATPAHSPRLRPHGFSDLQLPHLRHLSLNQNFVPALAPMEPSTDREERYVAPQSSGLRIGDIISRSEGAQRKLPVPQVPKVAVQDLLNGPSNSGFSSGNSSSTPSLAGEDLAHRT